MAGVVAVGQLPSLTVWLQRRRRWQTHRWRCSSAARPLSINNYFTQRADGPTRLSLSPQLAAACRETLKPRPGRAGADATRGAAQVGPITPSPLCTLHIHNSHCNDHSLRSGGRLGLPTPLAESDRKSVTCLPWSKVVFTLTRVRVRLHGLH